MKMKKKRKTYAAHMQNYPASQAKDDEDYENIGKKWYNVVSFMFVLNNCYLCYKANAAYL